MINKKYVAPSAKGKGIYIMAVFLKNKKGRDVVLLNPAEKARKFADELGNGVKQTNTGMIKFGKDGRPVKLTDTEKAFRSGYLNARKDSAKVFKSKNR